jgi:hypothetical protein
VGDEASEAAAGISVVRTSTVKVTTIPALLRDVGLPSNAKVLAKMDVEGSEWALLRQPDALRQLSEIYGETHAVGAPADPDSFLRRASAGAGFERVDAGQGFVHWRRPPDRCFVASPTDSCHLARPFTDLSPLDDAADATH